MHVIICGGRDRHLTKAGYEELTALHTQHQFTCVWHGACPGSIDTEAGRWAEDRGIRVEPRPAEWTQRGTRAGPTRNAQMLRECRRTAGDIPVMVIGFQGNDGTKDMLKKAAYAGVTILDLRDRKELTMPEMTATAPESKLKALSGPPSAPMLSPTPPQPDDIPDPAVPPEALADTAQDAAGSTTLAEQSASLPEEQAAPYSTADVMLHGFCEALQSRLSTFMTEASVSQQASHEVIIGFMREWVEKQVAANEHAQYQFSNALLKIQEHGVQTSPPYQATVQAVSPTGYPVSITIMKADMGQLTHDVLTVLGWLQQGGCQPVGPVAL